MTAEILHALPDGKVWYNVYDAGTLQYICSVSGDPENPECYDPRINGSGEVVWQKAD